MSVITSTVKCAPEHYLRPTYLPNIANSNENRKQKYLSKIFPQYWITIWAKHFAPHTLMWVQNQQQQTRWRQWRTQWSQQQHIVLPCVLFTIYLHQRGFARCMIKEKVAKLAARVNFILSSLYCYYDYFIIFVVRY